MVTCVDTKVTKMIIPFITPILKSLVVPVIWLALIDGIYSWIASIFCLNYIFFPANEEVTIKTKQPIRFQGLFKVTNQIAGKWETKSITWQILQLLFPKLLLSPPPQKKKWWNLISDRLSTASIKYLNWPSTVFGWFQNGCKKVEESGVSVWITLHSVRLPLFIAWDSVDIFKVYGETVANLGFNTWV